MDGLGARDEVCPAVRSLVALRAARLQALDIEILHVRRGIGETPRDALVVPEHHRRHAGQRGARDIQPGSLQLGEVPQRRRLQPEVRIIGQQRLARTGMSARHHPVVRAHALHVTRRRPLLDARHGRGQRRQVPVEIAVVHGAQRPIAGIRRQQLIDARHRQHLRQPHAQRLLGPVAAQVPRHHGLPGQRIGRLPVLGPGAQEQELRRQRSLVAIDIGIHAIGIGLQHGPGLGRGLGQDGLGVAPHAQGTQEAVGIQRARPQDFRQATGHDALAHLQLPQPILRVDEAERKVGILRIGRLDMRHGMAVPNDRYAITQAGQLQRARGLRLRCLAIPDISAKRADQQQHRQRQYQPGQPFQPTHRSLSPRGVPRPRSYLCFWSRVSCPVCRPAARLQANGTPALSPNHESGQREIGQRLSQPAGQVAGQRSGP